MKHLLKPIPLPVGQTVVEVDMSSIAMPDRHESVLEIRAPLDIESAIKKVTTKTLPELVEEQSVAGKIVILFTTPKALRAYLRIGEQNPRSIPVSNYIVLFVIDTKCVPISDLPHGELYFNLVHADSFDDAADSIISRLCTSTVNEWIAPAGFERGKIDPATFT